MGKNKTSRTKARLPRGFADRSAEDIRRTAAMLDTIRGVYERWGFDPVETPFIEYADALGKFLPDADRPNEGVFAFEDDDGGWLSLRYDLTAPLARMVAENFDALPKPYKSYRAGWVFRNEKPGPGRYRQFMQCDADIVGAASPLADAEIAMMAAETMETLGFNRGEFVVKLNSRRVLDAVLDAVGLTGDAAPKRLGVMRSIDKADKFAVEDIALLLTTGRKDESGDFTPGVGLSADQADAVLDFFVRKDLAERRGADPAFVMDDDETLMTPGDGSPGLTLTDADTLTAARKKLAEIGADPEAISDLETISQNYRAAGFGTKRIQVDLSVVRGLEYYTGCVFETELTFDVFDEKGERQKFGSVGGGGRYDGLVGRFRAQDVPATGYSVGVSRLAAAIATRTDTMPVRGPVIVTVLDRDEVPAYQAMTAKLRAALNSNGLEMPVEMYIGDSGMKAQLKYADRRNAPCVIIQGSEERAAGKVQIKDLAAGRRAAQEIDSRDEWVASRPAQVEVDASIEAIVAAVRHILQ